MVSEIFVDTDTAERAAQLEAALDAFEFRERGQRDVRRDADVRRRGNRRERVLEIVVAELRPAAAAARRALLEDAEARLGADRVVAPEPTSTGIARAEPRERRPNAAREQPVDVLVACVGDDEP